MIDSEQWMDIKELHRLGLSGRQIAKQTGFSRNTIAKILGQNTPKAFQHAPRPSALDPFKPYLKARWETYQLSGTRLHQEIQAQGFHGSVDIVQRYLRTLKDGQVASNRATVRFETPPGQQAQADWAEVGLIEGRKVYAFVLILSFSRMLFVTFRHSMALPELIACHQEAFEFFGGVPASILYDNMAQVRLPHSKELHPLMVDFAAHYGFSVRTHRPYRPRTKGKVERSIQHLQEDFLKGRAFADLEDLVGQARNWLALANTRVHATTGERPSQTHLREKLISIESLIPYVLATRYGRRVDSEGFVRVKGARYSTGPEAVGKRVVVAVGEQSVTIRLKETIVAEHRPVRSGESSTHPEHIRAFWKLARQNLSQRKTPLPKLDLTSRRLPKVEVCPLSRFAAFEGNIEISEEIGQ